VHKNAVVSQCACIPLPGRIPTSGRVAGRSRFHRGVCDGCDPGDAQGPAPRALAGFTVASPQAGPLLRVMPAPAPPSAGAPGCGSRLAWRRFRRFSNRRWCSWVPA